MKIKFERNKEHLLLLYCINLIIIKIRLYFLLCKNYLNRTNNMRAALQERKRYFKFILIFLSAIILLLIPHIIGISGKQVAAADSNQFSVKVSTRGHFDLKTGELLSEHNKTDYTASNITGLPNGVCSNEVAIIVHGVLMRIMPMKDLLEQICH